MTHDNENPDLKIFGSYQQRLLSLSQKMDHLAYNQWTIECDRRLAEEYPERTQRQQYQLWHVLVGGGVEGSGLDFVGKLTVEKLIAEKEQEYAQG